MIGLDVKGRVWQGPRGGAGRDRLTYVAILF